MCPKPPAPPTPDFNPLLASLLHEFGGTPASVTPIRPVRILTADLDVSARQLCHGSGSAQSEASFPGAVSPASWLRRLVRLQRHLACERAGWSRPPAAGSRAAADPGSWFNAFECGGTCDARRISVAKILPVHEAGLPGDGDAESGYAFLSVSGAAVNNGFRMVQDSPVLELVHRQSVPYVPGL